MRVTKQWVSPGEQRAGSAKMSAQRFMVVRVSELRKFPGDREAAPEAWSSGEPLVESRERLLTLLERGVEDGEPLVREAGYDQRWLPQGAPILPASDGWTLENGNGWETRSEVRS